MVQCDLSATTKMPKLSIADISCHIVFTCPLSSFNDREEHFWPDLQFLARLLYPFPPALLRVANEGYGEIGPFYGNRRRISVDFELIKVTPLIGNTPPGLHGYLITFSEHSLGI